MVYKIQDYPFLPFLYLLFGEYVINVMYSFVYCVSIRNKCHQDNDGEYLHRLQFNYTFCELYILHNALVVDVY